TQHDRQEISDDRRAEADNRDPCRRSKLAASAASAFGARCGSESLPGKGTHCHRLHHAWSNPRTGAGFRAVIQHLNRTDARAHVAGVAPGRRNMSRHMTRIVAATLIAGSFSPAAELCAATRFRV